MNARVLPDSPASTMAGRPNGRPPLRLAAALAVLAAAVAILGPAGGQTAATVEILSPKADALHTSGTLTVRVRTRGEHTGFQAHLRGSTFAEVTDRFRSPRRGVWTAKFRLGHELVLGRNHLFVQVQRPSGEVDTQAVHFTAARRARGLLGLGVRLGAQRAPVTVRARAPHADGVRATLNGRDAGHLFEGDGAGRWVARLATNDGLRFGRNRLTVTAFTNQGEYERIERTIRLERTRPLVGAGRDTTTRTGTPVQLDGRATRAAGRGPLELAWQIDSRPAGSTATLRGARSARPSLRPDVPGEYTIRLRASEARSEATDTVTVTVQPNVLPAGIPVTTIVSSTAPGVLIDQQFYALAQPGWLQLLVLDRATALPSTSFQNPNRSYPGTDQGMSDLASDVGTLSPTDHLAILSGSGQPAALSTSGSSTLAGVLNTLGGILQPGTGSLSQLASGQWSLMGIPGLPPGTAYQNIGRQLDTDLIAGSLTGFFQLDTSGNFTFTWPPTFLTFDTQATGTSATQNLITVGSETYTSAQVPNGQGAFHVVWLDSGSLALQGQYTAVASEAGCGANGPLLCLSDLASSLESIVDSQSPALLLVATMGQPAFSSADQTAWAVVAQMLNSMGAQPYVLLDLDGTGDYSFVGTQGLLQLEGPNSGTELGQLVTGSPTARLVGLLQRNRQSNWMAGPNGSPGPGIDPTVFQPSLQQILAQTDDPFEQFTGSALAAEQYIACKLGMPIDPQYGIRANYWQNDSITWSTEQTDLSNLGPCRKSDPCFTMGCTTEAFEQVQQTLVAEFGDVATVTAFLYTKGGGGQLWGVFNSAFTDGSVGFTAISENILTLYAEPPPQPPQGGNSSSLMEALTTIASGAAGPIPVAGSIISGAFNISRGVVMLMDYLDNDAEGVPSLDTRAFGADLTEWGSALQGAWTGSVASLGLAADLLVSDAGRLSAAAARVNVAGTDAVCSNDVSIECSSSADCGGAECLSPGWGWGLNDGSGTNVTQTIARSIAQYLWWTMLPVPVAVVPCGDQWPTDLDPAAPYPPLLRDSWLDARWVVDVGSGLVAEDVYAILLSFTSEQEAWAVPAATLEQLFDPNQVGLQKPYFYAEAWMDGSTPVTPGFVYSWGSGIYYGCFCYPGPPNQCSD